MTRRRTSCSLSDLGIHSSYALRIQSAAPQILPLPRMRFSKIGRNFIGSLFQNQKPESRKAQNQIRTYVTSTAVISTPVQPSTHRLLVRSLNNLKIWSTKKNTNIPKRFNSSQMEKVDFGAALRLRKPVLHCGETFRTPHFNS